MSTYSNERETSPFVILYLVIFILLIAIVVRAVSDAISMSRFDKSFDNGQLSLEGNFTPLGTAGEPATSSLPEWMPSASESIFDHPRLYEVKDCVSLKMPEKATGVYAVTPYFAPEQITITVPSQSSGTVNVCVPKGVVVQVVLWANQ